MEKYLDYVLEDDSTEYGGIAFIGETVRHFINEVGENPESLEELNEMLVECGIKPIR